MNNINMLDSNLYAIQQTQASLVGNITPDNNAPTSDARTLQDFSALAKLPGMMSSLLHGQSLMTQLDTRPTLSEPPKRQEKINAADAHVLMKLTYNMNGSDINKLERAAASAATLFNTQPNLLQTVNPLNTATKSSQFSVSSAGFAAHPAHSQRALEGGTDITSVDATSPHFINVMGDLKMMLVNNQLTLALTKQEAESAKSSAQSSIRTVEAANRAGNKGIDAERQRMNGVISSGTVGLVGQGITASRTMRALNAESKSIDKNLAQAIKVDSRQGMHQSTFDGTVNQTSSSVESLKEGISGVMTSSAPLTTELSSTVRNKHNQVQLKGSHTRAGSDYGNAIINSGQKMIEGGFNIGAAGESKEADMARADQSVNNEIANTHQQVSRKAAETKAALTQFFENTLNNNNNAASSVADRLR